MNPESILSLEEVGFSYEPGLPMVLQHVSFDVQPATVTAILGPNGAGKTTLLHLLLQLHHPSRGAILLDGLPLPRYSRRSLSRWMGLVPQSEHVPFEYSVLEYVLLGRAPYLNTLDLPGPQDMKIARQALDEAGIGHLAYRPVPRLSGGELQLVLLARALAQQPRILLLDEPTAHLDLANTYQTLKILHRLCDQGATILFTTHDPNAAAQIADRVVLFRQGRVVASGSQPETLTAELLSQTYGLPVEVLEIDGRRMIRTGEIQP